MDFLIPIFLILLLIILCIYDTCNRNRRLTTKIPGPRSFPIVGNSIYFLGAPVELFKFLRTLFKKYGAIHQMHALHLRTIGVLDPKLIEIIMTTTLFNYKNVPYNFLKPWLNEGLLVSNGAKWHQRRKLLTQAFHFNILKRYAETFSEETEKFLTLVQARVGEERTNISPLITSATLRVMCVTAMGHSENSDYSHNLESVARKYLKAIEVVGLSTFDRLRQFWLHNEWLFNMTRMARAQKKALADLHVFTNNIINERRKLLNNKDIKVFDEDEIENTNGMKGKLAMLDLLLVHEKLKNIDNDGIREEVDTFLFEGHDTTAQALTYMLMTIANETIAQNKLYDELQAVFGDSQRLPTMEDLNELKYLDCCIKESLRLYPSVPIIIRYITEETTLGDYTIPANSHIHIPIFDLHRREDIYPEPEKFIPERFLPENSAKRHPYAYLPFSAGPRNCIGQKFAMLEMKTLISSLLRRFRLEAVTKPSDLHFRTDIILRTDDQPVYVRFHNRQ